MDVNTVTWGAIIMSRPIIKMMQFLVFACVGCFQFITAASHADNDYAVLKRPVRTTGPRVTSIGGQPVHLYGDLYVYSQSPDFLPDRSLQYDNPNPRTKIDPAKPWEIRSNYLGIPARIVEGGFNARYSFVSPHAEHELYWPVHLIDGDPDSFWMIRRDEPYEKPMRTEPFELRIDLPREFNIRQVNMLAMNRTIPEHALRINPQGVPPEQRYYNPMPRELEVQVSRDGRHWDTVYQTDDMKNVELGGKVELPFLPRAAKQVRLLGNDFGPMIHPDQGPFIIGLFFGYTWSFAELELLDDKGNNVALASRGAGITQYEGRQGQWDFDVKNDVSLATRYDLGAKWIRANYWGGNLMWHYVEQEKGKYVIDPVSDLAVDEASKNGIEVIMGLEYGNWLYADPPRPNLLNQFDPILMDPPPAPTTPEQIEAYKNWVRFMVNHFKDRITWWEIWNEPGTSSWRYGFGGDRAGARNYASLIKAVVPLIKQIQPHAKVMVSNAYWPWPVFREEVFRHVVDLIDGFELHVRVYEWSLDGEQYRNLPNQIVQNKKEAEDMGYDGIYLSQENQWFPEPNPAQWLSGHIKPTFIGQAKNMARLLFQNSALDLVSFWQGGLQMESGTLAPSYYVLRTLATITDGATPADIRVETDTRYWVDHFGLKRPDGSLLLGAWLPGDAVELHPGLPTNLEFPGIKARSISGVDVMNGVSQTINFESGDTGTVVSGLVLRDYPIVLQINTD